jgi:nitrite reductase (cytochrome c-552)
MTPATRTRSRMASAIWLIVVGLFSAALLSACAAPPEPKTPEIQPAPAAKDPKAWAPLYPVEYARWLATAEPRPADKSAYKRGYDGGYTFDKLSELPFMPLLFKGWGFGIEYNEPRGHWWMLRDQQEVDPARVKAGGACITCKSPYSDELHTKYGAKIMGMPYNDAVALIPEGEQQLGVSCIDCHDNTDLSLRSPRWTMKNALEAIGLTDPNQQQRRLIVCGQCHCTYSVMKKDGVSVDVNYPWQGSTWGNISVENIISQLETDPARLEWTQAVTGFHVGFIRHPDIEFFTAQSVHYKAGLACPDCHMPYITVEGTKTADHDIISPLKTDMRACVKCHPENADDLKQQVLAIQNRNLSMLMDTGYAVAANAKLFEAINSKLATQSPQIKPDYDRAKGYYLQAFYRLVFMGAENSMGFHNPSEGGRILRDAMAYSQRADGVLRQIATKNGMVVPDEIDLQLGDYLTDRGTKKLGFVGSQLFTDVYPTHDALWPKNSAALKSVPVQPPSKSVTMAEALAATGTTK